MKNRLRVINVFEKIRTNYLKNNNPKSFAYGKAIISLSQITDEEFETRITKGIKIPYIGDSMKSKIDEIIKGTFKEKGGTKNEFNSSNIANAHKHYVSREVVANFYNEFTRELSDYINVDIRSELLGSYRRGKPYCGDADILFVSENDISNDVIKFLELKGDTYEIINRGSNKIKFKILGSDQNTILGNFETDIRFCSPSEFGSYILMMTGSKQFNINMRAIASSKGYSLSEYGLFDLRSKTLLRFSDEESIFKKLGIDYVQPNDR